MLLLAWFGHFHFFEKGGNVVKGGSKQSVCQLRGQKSQDIMLLHPVQEVDGGCRLFFVEDPTSVSSGNADLPHLKQRIGAPL